MNTRSCRLRWLGGQPPLSSSLRFSNAGGLGTLGAAYLPPGTLREQVREIHNLTEGPFGVKLGEQEEAWIERCVRTLIWRAGEHARIPKRAYL